MANSLGAAAADVRHPCRRAQLADQGPYQRRFKIVALVFLSLPLADAIGWLLFAGVREHAP
ncbi:MAG: hypothetical protein P4L64_12525 [Caulobacteraceae bacterium]|nr:hypothetical protein [Caulobacteraceae bacterium]